MFKDSFHNVSIIDRIARVAAGLGLIYLAALQPGVLNMVVILPLVAIYPLATGFLGWDPVYQFIARIVKRRNNRTAAASASAAS